MRKHGMLFGFLFFLPALAAAGCILFLLPARLGAVSAFLQRAGALLPEETQLEEIQSETTLTAAPGTRAAAQSEALPQNEKGEATAQENPAAAESAPAAETAAPAETPEKAAAWQPPEDIAAMAQAFLTEAQSKKSRGSVKERFFVNDGATFVSGGVAVRSAAEEHAPDFEALLNEGTDLIIDDISAPQVLVFHTHTTESYLPAFTGAFYEAAATRSKDPARNMVRVGDEICGALREKGIGCIHDTSIYDDTYEGAYARSREAVKRLLAENPTVQIVLDVHRDAVYETDTLALKPTAVIGGRKAAQIMIITGVQEGPVTDFPEWEKNLRFALALQKQAQTQYEGLMKPVFFCRRRYNMDLTPFSLLLEFGSDTNTLEEAVYSGRLMGSALAEYVLQHAKKE